MSTEQTPALQAVAASSAYPDWMLLAYAKRMHGVTNAPSVFRWIP